MKLKDIIFYGCFLGVLIAVFLKVLTKKPPVEDSSQTEVEYLIHQIHLRDSIIQTWEDHAVRMKRIAGVPDTVEWSYKQKIIHPIKIK